MRTKKLLALGMAAVMMLSSAVTVFADVDDPSDAHGTISGDGTLEGYVDKDVFTVTLPTTTDVDFKLDPQELMKAASVAATLDDASLSAGYGSTALFTVSTNKYASKSNDITVVNKSTFPVAVTINATLSGLSASANGYAYDIAVTDEASLTDNTNTAIAMKITETDSSLSANDYAFAADGTVEITSTVDPIANIEDAYKVTVSANGTYLYGLKSAGELADASVSFNSVTYNLSGKVNTEADWSDFNELDGSLAVEITYSIDKADATEVVMAFLQNPNRFVIGIAMGTPFPANTTITDFKLNNVSCEYSFDQAGYIQVTDTQSADALGGFFEDYTATFKIGDVAYTASYSFE